MNRITRLKIENFRRLKSLDLEMRPLGVMVGANGSGKTSIFDALSIIAAAFGGKLNDKMSEFGGFMSIITQDDCSERMKFGIEVSTGLTIAMNDEGEQVFDFTAPPIAIKYYYEMEILPQGSSFRLDNIVLLTTNQSKANGEFFTVIGNDSDLKYVSEPLKDFLRYHSLDVSRRAPVRLPQQIAPDFLPKQDGENLLSVLYNLREQQPEAYDEIIETLKVAFPGFESLALPNVAAGMMSLAWNDRNFRNALYQHQMSEGMLRMLWLTTILLNPHLTPLTMIDEPEVSLHPELLAILVGCFRKATAYTQLLAATHSTDLIRNLHPAEVLVLDMDENGMTSARWGDDPELNLDDWLKDYTLGDVWQMGLLGGRAS